MKEFVECKECAVKTGSPALCPSCLNNRTAIGDRDLEIAGLKGTLKGHHTILDTIQLMCTLAKESKP